jgi:hypothetical protein
VVSDPAAKRSDQTGHQILCCIIVNICDYYSTVVGPLFFSNALPDNELEIFFLMHAKQVDLMDVAMLGFWCIGDSGRYVDLMLR